MEFEIFKYLEPVTNENKEEYLMIFDDLHLAITAVTNHLAEILDDQTEDTMTVKTLNELIKFFGNIKHYPSLTDLLDDYSNNSNPCLKLKKLQLEESNVYNLFEAIPGWVDTTNLLVDIADYLFKGYHVKSFEHLISLLADLVKDVNEVIDLFDKLYRSVYEINDYLYKLVVED